MNIYDYIKKDHQKVASLFKQFTKTVSKERKKDIANTIAKELIVHLESEQQTFYKALKNFPESRGAVQHGGKEHDDIEAQINTILSATSVTSTWEKKVLKLKAIVEHHVQEEEGLIHKLAKKVLSDREAVDLKEKMHSYKKKISLEIQAPAQKSISTAKKRAG